MKTQRHTRGPWLALPDTPKGKDRWTVSNGEDLVCQLFNKYCEFENAEANARLIAAAPSLYNALSDLLNLVEFAEMSSRDMPAHEFEAIRDDAERQARAALSGASK